MDQCVTWRVCAWSSPTSPALKCVFEGFKLYYWCPNFCFTGELTLHCQSVILLRFVICYVHSSTFINMFASIFIWIERVRNVWLQQLWFSFDFHFLHFSTEFKIDASNGGYKTSWKHLVLQWVSDTHSCLVSALSSPEQHNIRKQITPKLPKSEILSEPDIW